MAKVIIIGGGVAGMSAAHELIERGFEVEVYEKKKVYVGGKARSVNVQGTNLMHKDKYLPGEHGFRFFPGFYKHVTDTMKRIPFQNIDGSKNKNGVFDNLTHTTEIALTRYDMPTIKILANFPKSLKDFELLFHDIFGGIQTGLTHEEESFFVKRIWQLMISCEERKNQEYEKISWWKYLEADRFSEAYRHLLVEGLTRTLVAARAEIASMKTGSSITLQLMYSALNPGVNVDRVLNGPTNEKWLNPWYDYLISKGVKYHKGHEGVGFELKDDDQTIDYAKVKNEKGEQINVRGDYYILCAPVEKAAEIIDDKMIQKDDQFQFLCQLAESTAWMNGMQFYLNEDVQIAHGHVCHSYTEWALTSISQVQFWKDYDLSERYNGKVKGVLSVDISDWLYTTYKSIQNPESKPEFAENCKPEEVKNLVWEQLKRSVNVDGQEILKDEMIEFWYLDRDIKWIDELHHETDQEPLLVNSVNSWSLRPTSYTAIPNFFLASDYVRTNTDLATMEGANEAARRAVNDIIYSSGSDAKLCEIWPLSEPSLFNMLKRHDKKRFEMGLPFSHEIPLWLEIFMVIYTPIWMVFTFIKSKF
jgi:uncharacterized protein with NAD-binding domain and iron-sulfur cluster